MYLHIGNGQTVKKKEIIGIFDMDTATVMKATRTFLKKKKKNGSAETLSYELPKSFTVVGKRGTRQKKIYISQITPATLQKRSEDKF